MKLAKQRQREALLKERIRLAEVRWIRDGDKRTAKALTLLEEKLRDLRGAMVLPPIAHDGKHLILCRDTESSPTDQCPFCGERHSHGIGDGHRTAHCRVDGAEVEVGELTLRQTDGYVVHTRHPVEAFLVGCRVTSLVDAYDGYVEWCRGRSVEPVPMVTFVTVCGTRYSRARADQPGG